MNISFGKQDLKRSGAWLTRFPDPHHMDAICRKYNSVLVNDREKTLWRYILLKDFII